MGLILDALDDIIDAHEANARQPAIQKSIRQLPASPSRHPNMVSSEDSMNNDQHEAPVHPQVAETHETGPQHITQEALLWGMKVLQKSANGSKIADQQIQGFLMQHGHLLSSLSLAISTGLQALIMAVPDGNCVGLALLANAHAGLLGPSGTSSTLESFLHNICSSASIFEVESQSIANEVQRREKLAPRSDECAEAGERLASAYQSYSLNRTLAAAAAPQNRRRYGPQHSQTI